MPRIFNGVTFLSWEEVRERIGFNPDTLPGITHEQTFFYRGMVQATSDLSDSKIDVFAEGFFYSEMEDSEWMALRYDGADDVHRAFPACAVVSKKKSDHAFFYGYPEKNAPDKSRFGLTILEPVSPPVYVRESWLAAKMKELGIGAIKAVAKGDALDGRRLNNLLRVIRVLAMGAGFSGKNPYKEAEPMLQLGVDHGIDIPTSKETLAGIIKDAFEMPANKSAKKPKKTTRKLAKAGARKKSQ